VILSKVIVAQSMINDIRVNTSQKCAELSITLG